MGSDNPFAVPLASEQAAAAQQQAPPAPASDNPFDVPLQSEAQPPTTASPLATGGATGQAPGTPLGAMGGSANAGQVGTNAAGGLTQSAIDQIGGMMNALTHPVSTILHMTPIGDLTDSVKQATSLFDAYEKARTNGASIGDAIHAANQQAQAQEAATNNVKQAVDAFKKNPGQESVRQLANLVNIALGVYGGAGAPETAAGEVAPAAEETAATASNPGIIQELKQGKAVAQAPAQSAIRNAVGASEDTPILENENTVTDAKVSDLQAQAKQAYAKRDAVAGFDTKEAEDTLRDAQRSIKQPGQTDKAIARTQAKITDIKSRLADAQKAMKDADIDPQEGPQLFKQASAGKDFTKALRQATSSDGATVNIDGLLTRLKNLQVTKYGNRVEQFLGEDGAKQLMNDLHQAQAQGVHALKTQALAAKIAKYTPHALTGAAALGGIAYEATH